MNAEDQRKLEEIAQLEQKLSGEVEEANRKIAEFEEALAAAKVGVTARVGRLSYSKVNDRWCVAIALRDILDVTDVIIKLSGASRQVRIEYAAQLPKLLDAILENLRKMNEHNERLRKNNNEER